MSYIESDLTLGNCNLSKRYATEGIIEDTAAYLSSFSDDDRYMAVREALQLAISNNPNLKDAPFITYSAAMILHQKQIFEGSAGFLEFAFSEEVVGNPVTDKEGNPHDDKTTYAIAYLFALEHWRKEVESEKPEELQHLRDTLTRKWEIIYEATCLVELFRDRIGHHRFSTDDLEAASTLGREFLVRATSP